MLCKSKGLGLCEFFHKGDCSSEFGKARGSQIAGFSSLFLKRRNQCPGANVEIANRSQTIAVLVPMFQIRSVGLELAAVVDFCMFVGSTSVSRTIFAWFSIAMPENGDRLALVGLHRR